MIKKKFDNVSNILNDPTIPESLKLKLYLSLRSKYDMARNKPDIDNINNENEISFDSSNMAALTQAVSSLPKKQRGDAKKVAEILTSKDYHAWDQFGNIIAPNIPGMRKFDLTQLMKMILYKDYGTQKEINILSKLLKPYVNSLLNEDVIHNDNLLSTKYFKGYHEEEKLTKYMSW